MASIPTPILLIRRPNLLMVLLVLCYGFAVGCATRQQDMSTKPGEEGVESLLYLPEKQERLKEIRARQDKESSDVISIGSGENTPESTDIVKRLPPVRDFTDGKTLRDFQKGLNAITREQAEMLLSDNEVVDVLLPAQIIPEFIDTVFGVLLRVPYFMGRDVSSMSDVVTMRGSPRSGKVALLLATQEVLKDYGIAMQLRDNVIAIEKAKVYEQQTPRFIRGRADRYAPDSSRPVVHFFDVRSLSVVDLNDVLKEAFPDKDQIKFKSIRSTNTLVMSGDALKVAEAAAIANELDQPYFAGGFVAQINPIYLSADELATEMSKVMSAEGLQVTTAATDIKRAVVLLPIDKVSRLLVFSNYRQPFERAIYWARNIDQPSTFGDKESYFIYKVRNTDAERLTELVQSVLGGGGSQTPTSTQRNVRATQTSTQRRDRSRSNTEQRDSVGGGQLTADLSGNRILFRGTAEQYAQVRTLLERLDTPPPQVLLEVTIAELQLEDEAAYGTRFFFQDLEEGGLVSRGGRSGVAGAIDSVSATNTDGFVFDIGTSDFRAVLEAQAKNKRVKVLSSPNVVARSGEEAYVEVGSEVPVVSTRSATPVNQTGSNFTDVLQTIVYRKTGIILTVTPVVYGEDRIDLTIKQEVSSSDTRADEVTTTPSIRNRTITSQITVSDGSTAVLGGLMQDDSQQAETGIPVLKDIPVVGNLFKRRSINSVKTELMMFVTAYIIRNEDEAAALADVYATDIIRNTKLNYDNMNTLTARSLLRLRPAATPAGLAKNPEGVQPSTEKKTEKIEQ